MAETPKPFPPKLAISATLGGDKLAQRALVVPADETGKAIMEPPVADCGFATPQAIAFARLFAAAPDYHKAVADLLQLWPLSGYELEAYMDATFIPAIRAIQAKTEGR